MMADGAQDYKILKGMLFGLAPKNNMGFLQCRWLATTRASVAAFDHQFSLDVSRYCRTF
jgi:hypothetical protein